MNLKLKALTKSLWVFHLGGASCNNCCIEILDLLTPRFDAERFGIVLVGSARHADVLLVAGVINKKDVSRVKKVYSQVAKPCVVIAIGSCAITQGMFRDSYNVSPVPVDKIIPVDAYVPGCPPKPEAMLSAVVKLIAKLQGKS